MGDPIRPFFVPYCLGGDSCCRGNNWCMENEGDCDAHGDCERGLLCGDNNCGKFGDHRDKDFDSTDDCCYKPTEKCTGGDGCCKNGICGWGEGDCEYHRDCRIGKEGRFTPEAAPV